MIYDKEIEQFVDFVNWTKNDPSIWVVYPAGCIGDLVSSIINFHYASTGAKYLGISNSGQVIFRSSDGKKFNKTDYSINDSIEDLVNESLSENQLNYSKIDQIIFSNHSWHSSKIKDILKWSLSAKIIRILPKNKQELNIINWLASFKNFNILNEFNNTANLDLFQIDSIDDPRFLEIYFSDILSKNTFDQTYNKIIDHLGLEYKLIRYDFIEYYISRQHQNITPALLEIANN